MHPDQGLNKYCSLRRRSTSVYAVDVIPAPKPESSLFILWEDREDGAETHQRACEVSRRIPPFSATMTSAAIPRNRPCSTMPAL